MKYRDTIHALLREFKSGKFLYGRGCTSLGEFESFREEHITRALEAAKNPQLRSKLENMPVPMTPEQVDAYMGSILRSAATGDLSLIRSMN